jgi:hypothetical protein
MEVSSTTPVVRGQFPFAAFDPLPDFAELLGMPDQHDRAHTGRA